MRARHLARQRGIAEHACTVHSSQARIEGFRDLVQRVLTASSTHVRLSSLTIHAHSRSLRSLYSACSVCAVWSKRPDRPPYTTSWCWERPEACHD